MERYKTPVAKLCAFFRRSRNGWKRKCQETKRLAKYWSNRSRALEASREKWKQEARRLRNQVHQLHQELEEQKIAG